MSPEGIDANLLFEQRLEFIKVSCLVACFAPHVFSMKIGYLRVESVIANFTSKVSRVVVELNIKVCDYLSAD